MNRLAFAFIAGAALLATPVAAISPEGLPQPTSVMATCDAPIDQAKTIAAGLARDQMRWNDGGHQLLVTPERMTFKGPCRWLSTLEASKVGQIRLIEEYSQTGRNNWEGFVFPLMLGTSATGQVVIVLYKPMPKADYLAGKLPQF